MLNATNFDTDNLFGLWVAQDLDDPTRYVAVPPAGRARHARPRVLPRRLAAHGGDPRRSTRPTSRACSSSRAVPDAAAKAARIVELEHRIAAGARRARGLGGRARRATTTGRAPEFDDSRARPRLDGVPRRGRPREARRSSWSGSRGAVTGISALVASEPLDAWKDYLTFHAIEHVAPCCPTAFGEERFAFHGTVLAGIPQRRERWKRAVDATERRPRRGGRPAVRRAVLPARGQGARRGDGRRTSWRPSAGASTRLDWMAPATKAKAKEKLAALKVGVGYPDRWRDYAGLEVVRGDAFGNAQRAELFELPAQPREARPAGRPRRVGDDPADRQRGQPAGDERAQLPGGHPAAALLRPARARVAMDYGAIGAVIGHEISHSFDDQGALFDAAGRLRNWWTDADLRALRGVGRAAREAVRRLPAVPRPRTSTAS